MFFFYKFPNIHSFINYNKLQVDLANMAQWCEVDAMQLNVKKCHLMVVTRNRIHNVQIYIIIKKSSTVHPSCTYVVVFP